MDSTEEITLDYSEDEILQISGDNAILTVDEVYGSPRQLRANNKLLMQLKKGCKKQKRLFEV